MQGKFADPIGKMIGPVEIIIDIVKNYRQGMESYMISRSYQYITSSTIQNLII